MLCRFAPQVGFVNGLFPKMSLEIEEFAEDVEFYNYQSKQAYHEFHIQLDLFEWPLAKLRWVGNRTSDETQNYTSVRREGGRKWTEESYSFRTGSHSAAERR